MLMKFDTTKIPNVRFVGFISYEKPWMHFERTSEEYILYLIKNGSLYIEEEGKHYHLKKGSCIILEPGKRHVGYQNSICSYYYLHFKYPSLLPLSEEATQDHLKETMIERKTKILENCLLYQNNSNHHSYIPKISIIQDSSVYNYMLHSAIKDYNLRFEHYRELVGCRLLEFFIRLSRDYVSYQYHQAGASIQKKYIKAKTLLAFLSREYCRKITRKDIEDEMEASYDYLNRIFKEFTGRSIHQYLNIIRMNKAMELIETTPLKFSDIGLLVGIEDTYYFSKLFKKHVGMTPTEYLKSTVTTNNENN
jgi:AraC-like DNA-binding protein